LQVSYLILYQAAVFQELKFGDETTDFAEMK
jgi:hypothetical protein